MDKSHRNIIYTGIQIAWRLILGNIFLLLSNIVLILLCWNIKFALITSPLYILCSVTVFPSLVALVSYLRNDEAEDKIGLGFKVFLDSFKNAFKLGWLSGLIYEFVIVFLILDIISANKFMTNGQLFMPLLTLLLILSIVHAMWNILIQSYFYIRLKNAFMYSTQLLINKSIISLKMILLILGNYLSFKLFPQYAILFIIPLTAYILFKMTFKEFDSIRREQIIIKDK